MNLENSIPLGGSLLPDAGATPAVRSQTASANSLVPHTSIHRVEADGVSVFYREGGVPDASVVPLLHGFPTSSFQYRELIPRLADRYRVIAPDLPGFGFTEIPEQMFAKVFQHPVSGCRRIQRGNRKFWASIGALGRNLATL
jgi:pimeloyl-ACP methyl ester carboxylesterase